MLDVYGWEIRVWWVLGDVVAGEYSINKEGFEFQSNSKTEPSYKEGLPSSVKDGG